MEPVSYIGTAITKQKSLFVMAQKKIEVIQYKLSFVELKKCIR